VIKINFKGVSLILICLVVI